VSLFVYALAVVAGVVAFWTPLRVALMILVSSVLLVPSGLAVSGFAGYASVQRVVIVAVLLNLVRRLHRREISGQVFEITPVHAAFLVFLAVSAVVGIGLAQTTVPLGTSTHLWAAYVDEFAFFIVALATVRAIGDLGLIARDLAVLVIVSALFAIGDHITKDSWARLL
jgi:hypothetical protein